MVLTRDDIAAGYDFIVVGAGSSGCVVAHRLATRTAATVLLIEAGGPDSEPRIHDSSLDSVLSLWRPSALDWGYATVPQPGLGGRGVPVARGRVSGGSSSINALLYVRGNRRDYDRWAELGATGWDYLSVLPYFRDSENFDGGASAYRGVGGPLNVVRHADLTPVARQLFDAGSEIGLRDGRDGFDYNAAEQQDTVFAYQATKNPDGTRASAATAYLRPALGRSNLTVVNQALVARIVLRGGRAQGVEYVRGGQLHRVRAGHEVIVCGGAFESPHLLMLSGIGPAGQLRRQGIGIEAPLPGVGANLQDHVVVPVAYLSTHAQPGPASLIAETGFFTRTAGQGTHEPPGLQMAFGGLKFVPPPLDRDGSGFTFAPVLVQPRSTGSVALAGPGAGRRALVDPGYLTEPADIEALLEGVRTARALAGGRALGAWCKEEIAPGPRVRDRASLVAYLRAYAGTLWHPVGTCRMGAERDESAVVDPRLRVRGVEGLRVADASVMPRIVAGNTNAACVMIGEKAADLIMADYAVSAADARAVRS